MLQTIGNFVTHAPRSPSCAFSSSSSASAIPSSSPPVISRVLVPRRSFLHGCLVSTPLLLVSEPYFVSPSRAVDEDVQDWYRYEGKGFSVSVPPDFSDIMNPEDYMAGVAMYGDKAKPQTFAARFASLDRSEVLSVVIRQSSQLKLSFFAVKDVTDLGTLQDAASIFVPGDAKLYAARAISPSNEEPNKTYYYYEFASGNNYIALEAAAANGKVYVLGVTAPKSRWRDDYRKLRLAATSFSLL